MAAHNMIISNGVENLINGNYQLAASKSLGNSVKGHQPKTPGKILSHAPLVVPIRDENAPSLFGGKPGKSKDVENLVAFKKKNTTHDKYEFVTPMGPRNRAPLGTKTTNVKLNTSQTLARSALRTKPENTNLRVTSTRRPKKVIHPDTKKLEVCDAGTLYNTSDVEYCPPAIKEIPFESDTFPDNCLDYSRIQPQNLMKDLYKSNLAQLDANGLSKLEKEQEIAYQKDILNADEAAKKMMDEDWIIGDIPETFHHQQTQKEVIKPVKGLATSQKKQYRHCQVISTLTSSKATHSLPITSKQKTSQPKAYKHATKVSSATSLKKPTKTGLRGSNNVTENNNFSIANSKSTIGYSKGRSIHSKFEEQKLTDHKVDKSSHLSMLTESRTTKNPEHKSQSQNSTDHYFLKLFDVDDGELDPGLRGILPDSVNDGEDEDFFFTFS